MPGLIKTRHQELLATRMLVSLHSASKKVICIFKSYGFHGVVLHIKGFCFKMIDTSLQRRVKDCNTKLLCDWFERPLIPRKAKDRNVTRLDC